MNLQNAFFDRALALLDSPALSNQDTRAERAAILVGLGNLNFDAVEHQHRQRVTQLYEQSLAFYQALNDRWGMATTMRDICWVVRDFRDTNTVEQRREQLKESDDLARQCIALCREIGNQAVLASALIASASSSMLLGAHAKAVSTIEAAVELCHKINLKGTLVDANAWRSMIYLNQGDYARARAVNQLAFELAQELGYYCEITGALRTIGLIALAEGNYDEAQQKLQESVNRYHESGIQFQCCVAQAYLGIAQHHLGNMDAAQRNLTEALHLTVKHHSYPLAEFTLALAALQLAYRGMIKPALEINSLQSHLASLEATNFYYDIANGYVDNAATMLSSEEIAAAQERGRNLELWPTIEALLQEFSQPDLPDKPYGTEMGTLENAG